MVRTRLNKSTYFISAELRSAHALLYPSTPKICHTQFCNLIYPPLLLPTSHHLSPQPLRIWAGLKFLLLSDSTVTELWWDPSEPNEPERRSYDTRSVKWKCVQNTSSSQSKCCKWTKESSDWQSLGWERTHIKGKILSLLLLGFASFSLTFSQSAVTSACCSGNNGAWTDQLNCTSFQVTQLESGDTPEIAVVITIIIIIILC